MFEDLSKESAWAVTNSVVKFIIGALLSCCERDTISSIEVVKRRPSQIAIKNVNISSSLEQCHLNILKEHTLLTAPDMPIVERQKILSIVFHCEHITEQLKSVPESLKLVVIASRCWLNTISKTIDHHF